MQVKLFVGGGGLDAAEHALVCSAQLGLGSDGQPSSAELQAPGTAAPGKSVSPWGACLLVTVRG